MKCSVCRAELVVNGQEYLETSEEHVTCSRVTLKDKYVCSDPNCQTHTVGVCWNSDGEYYSKVFRAELPFIDGLKGAIGSFERKMEVELYKHDEDKAIWVCGTGRFAWLKWLYWLVRAFPCWPKNGWVLWEKCGYSGNEDGQILKRWRKYEWVRDDCTVYLPGLRMLVFCLKRIWRSRHCKTPWEIRELQDNIRHSQWPNPAWWRKASAFISKRILKWHGISVQ